MSHVLKMLRSLLPRESARFDLALTRGLFLLAVAVFWLPLPWGAAISPPIFAAYARASLFALSLILVVTLVARLACDSVGDSRSGFLQLLQMTGVTPAKWLALRWLQILIGFVGVWAIRLPLVLIGAIVFPTGGDLWLLLEGISLLTFVALGSFALLASHRAKSRQLAMSAAVIRWVIFEFMLLAPSLIAESVNNYTTIMIAPVWLARLRSLAETGLVTQSWLTLNGLPPSVELWRTAVVVLSLAGFLNWRLWRRLYADYSQADAGSAETKPGVQRSSRRSWQDALAWQAFCIHAGGRRSLIIKCIGLLLAGGLCWGLAEEGFVEQGYAMASVLGFALIMFTSGKPRDCLTREIQEQTLTVLLLTPHEGPDLYRGWRRGTWRHLWPEVLFGLGLAWAFHAANPHAPPVVLGIMGGILCGGPFFMLSPLVPFTFAGLATAMVVTAGVVLIIGSSIALAVYHRNALYFPLAAIPLSWLFNEMLRRKLLPLWLSRRLEKVL